MFLKQRVFFIAGFNEAENPFIIREDEYSKPLPPPPPVPRPSPVRPRPPSSASINLVAGTAESVSPYGNNDRSDGLTAPVITIGKFISVGQINIKYTCSQKRCTICMYAITFDPKSFFDL